MQISDETLMALADHQLDAATAARVSQAVAADPALAARLKRFTETRRLLNAARTAPAGAGDEDPLAATIRAGITRPAPKPAAPKPAAAKSAAPKPATRPANLNRRPLLAAAASMAVAVMGLGWWAWSDRQPDGLSLPKLAASELAAPELAALDSLPSGESRALGTGAELTMIASFRSSAGALCREFETAEPDSTRTVLACLGDDGWQPRFAEIARTGDPGYQPASGAAGIDAALAALGAGDPLTPEAEAAALGGNPPD